MGVSDRKLGQAVFRELEGRVEGAATQTLRGLCGDDRAARGWECRLSHTREQGFAWFRGGTHQ